MWRAFAKTAIVFTLGVFVSFAISTRPISFDHPSEALTQVHKATPYLNLQAATLLPAAGTSNILSEESINARFSGMLSHVRWLIDNQKENHGSRGGSSSGVSRSLFDKQIEKIADNTSDSISNLRTDLEAEINSPIATGTWQGSPITDAYVSNVLTIGAGSTFANNVVTPNSILATGQTDENCLTYEATGSTFEWQLCSNGFASTDIDTSAELAAILSDETGSGAAVFANSPTLTGLLTAASANFSGNVGIGTSNPASRLDVQSTVTNTSGFKNNINSKLYANPSGSATTATYTSADFITLSTASNGNNLGRLVGVYASADHVDNTILTNAYGVWADTANDGSNTVTNSSAFYAELANNSGTITNQKFFNVPDLLYNAGTIINTYGVYVGDITQGTQTNTPYSFYASDANAYNYFAGNVGIGTTSPASKLSIQNTGSAGSFLVEDQANDSTPFVIDSNGSVGIGTLTPNAKLAINGAVTPTGSELITNSTFTGSATGWTLGNCATYGSNQVTVTYTSCTQPYLSTTFSTVAGNTYYVTFTISNSSSNGGVDFYFYNNANNNEYGPFKDGTHTVAFTTTYTGTETIEFGGLYQTNETWTIDNVSIKQSPALTPALAVTAFDGTSLFNIGGTEGSVFLGRLAGSSDTNGFQNTYVGNRAGAKNTTGNRNTFLGSNAGANSTLSYLNTYVGNNAGFSDVFSVNNAFFGDSAGFSNTSGFLNTLLGAKAGYNTTTGIGNTVLGSYTGLSLATGNFNTLLGYYAGNNITTGSNNVIIGQNLEAPSATASNQLNIGNLLFGTGLDGTGTTLASGNIGIGTTTPLAKLAVTNSSSAPSFLVEDQANDSTPFVIDSNGKVGIGTSSPTSKFTIVGSTTPTIAHTFDSYGNLYSQEYHQLTLTNPDVSGSKRYSNEFSRLDIDSSTSAGIIFNKASNLRVTGASNSSPSRFVDISSVANYAAPNNSLAGMTAIEGGAYNTSGYKMNNVAAGLFTAYNDSANSLTINQTGVYGGVGNNGCANCASTSSVGVLGDIYNDVGTMVNAYGLRSSFYNTGTVNNTYGVYVDDITSGTQTNTPYSFYASDANAYNYFAGNVGIGTTTPASKLSIQNTGTGSSFLVEDQANDTTPFIITANGQVGVGTNAPFANDKMQIVDETSDFAHYALGVNLTGDSTVANSRYGGVDTYVTTKSGNATNFRYLFGVGAAVSHDGTGILSEAQGTYSYVENSSSGTITKATAYDAYLFNDTAASTITNFRYFAGNDLSNAGTITNTYGLYLGDLTSGIQTNAPYAIYSSDAGAKSYFAGNVGIGTTSPAQKLQVFGDIRVGTSGSNGCIENYGGGVIGGTCSSDAALKTDVIALAESKRSFLEGLTALTPVTYHWNETAADLYTKDKNMDNIGFIAQDVEAQFPELVSVNKDGYRQVNFTALPFYIIEALKELWTKVQGHDEKIIKLEEENKNLKERLETVEDKLNIIPPAPSPSVSPPPVEESSTPAAPSTNESITPTPAAVETLPVEPVSDVTQPSEPTSPTTTSEPSFTLVPGASQ